MNIFQKHQNTSGYNSIPDAIAADDETAAVPLGTPVYATTNGDEDDDHESPFVELEDGCYCRVCHDDARGDGWRGQDAAGWIIV